MLKADFSHQLDWCTLMFYDQSFQTVLSLLSLDRVLPYFVTVRPNFVEGEYCRSVILSYKNLSFTFPMSEFVAAFTPTVTDLATGELKEVPSWCSREMSAIRFNASGTGLQYMRSNYGIDVDVALRYPRKVLSEKQVKCTRCDVAYDFINRNPDILSKFFNFVNCTANLTKSKMISMRDQPAGLAYRKVTGATERTFYIGSSASKRILRIYDKKAEIMSKSGGVFLDDSFGPPDEVDSWIRIEWELKERWAESVFWSMSPDDQGYRDTLEFMYRKYDIIYPKTGGSFRIWREYFDPQAISELTLLNAYLV